MALLRLFDPTTQFQTKSGALNVAGKLRVYVESTDDLANIYGDDGSRLPQPLILDSNGRARGLFVNSGRSYRLETYDRNDSLLFTIRRLEPNASGTVILEEGKVSVEEGKPAGYLKDILVSASDMVSLVPSGNQLKVNFDLILPSDVVRDSAYTHIDAATEVPSMDGIASVGVSTKYAREDHVHPTDTSRENKANKTTVVLGTSDSKYPTDKAVAAFVNSSIATNTANYISNNGEPFTSVEQLEAYSGPVTNNDYAFVTGTDSEGNTYYDRYKATVSGETVTWALEYRLNNSSFTAAQWSAINSGITSALVAKIHTHSNKDVLDGITSTDVANWNSKQNSLTFDATPTAGSNNPVTSGGLYESMYSLSRPATPSSFTKDDKSYYFICRTNVKIWTRAAFEAYAFPVDWQTFDIIRIRSIVYADAPTDRAIVSVTCGKSVYEKFNFVQAVYNGYCYIFANNPFRPLYINPTKYINSDTNSSSMTQDIFQSLTLTEIEPSIDDVIFDTTPTAGSKNPVTSDGIKGELDTKLNVDGYNATNEGVTLMMTRVSSGSEDLNDDSQYFGDSNADHTKIVRRPILNIWNYIKNKVKTQLLGSVGSADKPIYLENGVPKVCTDGVPYSSVSYGGSDGCGVFVGGTHNLANTTRCYCTFLVTVSSYPDNIAHTYIGTFTFRGGILNSELKCVTGTPAYPHRIAIVYTKDGGTTENPTYTLGVHVIPVDKTYKYSSYKITRIASDSDFIWDVKNLSSAAYDELNSVAKPALRPIILTWDAIGSNITKTGSTWIPSFDKATIIDCRGIVDMSIQVDLSIIGQTTYIDDFTSYDITLVNSSKTDILPESLHQTGRMPRATRSNTGGGTIDTSCTHRFIFPITSSTNLLAGYRPKITLPSKYILDSGAQVTIKALCRGIVLPYGADEYF